MKITLPKLALILLAVGLVAAGCRPADKATVAPEVETALPTPQDTSVALPTLVTLEATLPALQPSSTPALTGAGSGFEGLLASGRISDVTVSAITQDKDTIGSILSLELTNPGVESLEVDVPCGFIFDAQHPDEQRMMVIQPLQVSLPAGGSQTVEPYVACIDGAKAAPDYQSVYLPGGMASGDLLTLAECLCKEEIDELKMITAQFAIWLVSEGETGEEDAAGESASDLLQEFYSIDLFGDPSELLRGCGLVPPGE